MTRNLTFGTTPPPKPLDLDNWTPTKGKAMTIWLPDDEFDAMAAKHSMQGKDGFALWGWWRKPKIYLRARCLGLFAHEAQHIERQINFHD